MPRIKAKTELEKAAAEAEEALNKAAAEQLMMRRTVFQSLPPTNPTSSA